jgi:hypothetical protein
VVVPADPKSEMATVTTGVNPDLQYTGFFQPYGSLRTIIGISNAGAQVQDDATRVGLNLATRGAIRVFGTTEWGINLVQSETTFNAGATTSSGFGVLNQVTQPVFGARLGYFGVESGKFGSLSFGKQPSTTTSPTTPRIASTSSVASPPQPT